MNANTTRDWAGGFLTVAGWNKLRPRVKAMGVRYEVSIIHNEECHGVFFEAFVTDREADAIEDVLSTL